MRPISSPTADAKKASGMPIQRQTQLNQRPPDHVAAEHHQLALREAEDPERRGR